LKANRQFAEGCVEAEDGIPPDLLTLLYDPQTAGGLLISVAASDAGRLLTELRNACVDAVEIGEVIEKQKPLIAILR
jgi:selenide,water dikinase